MLNKAKLLVGDKDFAGAEKVYREVLSIAPCEEAYIGLAKQLLALNHLEAALEEADQGSKLYESSDELLTINGELCLKVNKPTEAEELFYKAQELNPSRMESLVGLARAAMQKGELELAVTRWDVCLNNFPSHHLTTGWMKEKGNLLIRLGKHELAEELFLKLVDSCKEKPFGLLGMAQVSKARRDWSAAIRYWKLCIDHFHGDNNVAVWRIEMASAMIENRQFRDAESECLSVLNDEKSQMIMPYEALASLAMQEGKSDLAIEWLRKGCDKFPTHPAAPKLQAKIADFFVKKGKISEAVKICAEAIDRFSCNTLDKDVLQQLQRMKSLGYLIASTRNCSNEVAFESSFELKVFMYWSGKDSEHVKMNIDQWKKNGFNVDVLSDDIIVKILKKYYNEFVPVYKRINISACKSDIARLIYLYENGGVYIDAHVGLEDLNGFNKIPGLLEKREAIFFGSMLPGNSEFVLANSVIAAQKKSPIIKKWLDCAIDGLILQDKQELEHGFSAYNIYVITGIFSLFSSHGFKDINNFVNSKKDRIVVATCDEVGVKRYAFYKYREKDMHWSERQGKIPLFTRQEDALVEPIAADNSCSGEAESNALLSGKELGAGEECESNQGIASKKDVSDKQSLLLTSGHADAGNPAGTIRKDAEERPQKEIKLIFLGHPRCGCKPLTEFLKSSGIAVEQERLGNDGMVSWWHTGFGLIDQDFKRQFRLQMGDSTLLLNPAMVGHYIRYPLDAIPSIIIENEHNCRNNPSFRHRSSVIKQVFGVDISGFDEIGAAALSYIYWNRLAELYAPDFTVRIEYMNDDLSAISKHFDLNLPEELPALNTKFNGANKIVADKDSLLQRIDELSASYSAPYLEKYFMLYD
jgi:tetratricopeptide (TPR) repeat protein